MEDAQETLRAIQEGAVDALVIDTPEGQRVFTLQGADHTYRAVIEQMQEGAVSLTPEGVVQYCNDRFAAILNLPVESVMGGRMADFVSPAGRELLATMLSEGGGRTELSLMAGDTTEMPVLVSAILLRAEGPAAICMVVTDLTERKQAEKLRASEQHYRLLFDRNPDGVFAVDAAGRFILVNPACELISGYSAAELLQKTFMELCSPDRLADTLAHFEHTLRKPGYSQWETALVRKDGRRVELWIAGEPLVSKGQVTAVHCTAKDITERKRAEEELRAAKDSAEHAKAAAELANQAKDHFLAVLSHELRTPLTPVVMGVSILQDRPGLDPALRDTLEMVRRNVELEARLIDDLLDVSRIARGKVELTRSTVELSTVIHQAVEVCKPDIEERKLHFGMDLGPAEPNWVEADASRLQQVFWNLLKNAIKFTPKGGCVGIRCRPSEKYVIVEVNDSGLGIEPDALSRIFNAFEQADRSITRRFGGLGLGLAISKALVDMHGGQIEAHSEGRGKGATFRVRLPLTAPPGQPEECEPASPQQRAVRPLHILLVEDHPVTAKLMGMVLTTDGHTVEMAGDVATALELANQNAFELLFSDLGLPDGSGYDLIRQLRQRGHKFPGIALSGYGQGEDIQRSHEAGFAAHLTKPASRKAVIEAVASATAGEG